MKKSIAQSVLIARTRKLAAEETIEECCDQLVEEAKVLDPARFDELCRGLRALFKDSNNPHEEFFRRASTNDDRPGHPKDFAECVRFVKTFHEQKREIASALDGVETGRSDDGHHDLIDALGLAPSKIIKELVDDPDAFDKWERRHKKALKELLDNEIFNDLYLSEALRTYVPFAAEETLGTDHIDGKGKGNLTVKQIRHKSAVEVSIRPDGKPATKIEVPQAEFFSALAGVQETIKGTIGK